MLNAGLFGPATYEERGIDALDPDAFDTVHATNCRGVFLGIQAAANAQEALCAPGSERDCPRYASITALKSIFGSGGSAVSNAAYQSSKFCVDGLVRQAAVELARPQVNDTKALPHPIRVNAVSPGFAHSDMTDAFHSDPRNAALVQAGQAGGKWIDPRHVAKQVVALMSAPSVSGTDVFVDGGTHAQMPPLHDAAMQISTSRGCCGD